jgi:hypothetical protein
MWFRIILRLTLFLNLISLGADSPGIRIMAAAFAFLCLDALFVRKGLEEK